MSCAEYVCSKGAYMRQSKFGGLETYEQWQRSNSGDRMAWAKAILENLSVSYRGLRLDDRMSVKRALRELPDTGTKKKTTD